MAVVPPSEGTARDMIAEILPEQFEWERLVRQYPVPALLMAALGGYVLARNRGPSVLAAVGAFAGDKVGSEIDKALGSEILGRQ